MEVSTHVHVAPCQSDQLDLLAQLACLPNEGLSADRLSAAQRRKIRSIKLSMKRKLLAQRREAEASAFNAAVKSEEAEPEAEPEPDPTTSEDGDSSEETKSVGEETELPEQKRMMRRIRNRQSAALSRKRKADKITSLEQRILELEKENESLRVELTHVRMAKAPRQGLPGLRCPPQVL